MRAALYVRVSSLDQHVENQHDELHRYAQARGWSAALYADRGVSGAKERRAGLDSLLAAARRRQIDCVIVWRLDRLGRSLRHLIWLLDELGSLGVAFVSLGEGIDTSTPAGRLQLHVLGAIAEFERERIRERVRAGLVRARKQGKRLGRPPKPLGPEQLASVAGLSVRAAAKRLGISKSALGAARQASEKGSVTTL